MPTAKDTQLSPRADGLQAEEWLRMYYFMVLARTISRKAWLLNRQGRVMFSMAGDGQEAADVGSAWALQPGTDLLVPYARDLAAVLVLGMTTQEIMLNLFARADDPNSGGRQMPMHWSSKKLGIVSMGSPVAVTIPKAVGLALASKIRREPAVTMVYFGDGAASEGDFHEGLNFAGVMDVPVVFFCNNNGWATSVPFEKQTAGESIAMRAESYGFPGVEVDGMDVLPVREVTKVAVDRARSGEGPTLIEAHTIRMMPHSISDDHTRYRTREELESEQELDPLEKFKVFLLTSGVLDADKDKALWEKAEAETEDAIAFAEAAPEPAPESSLERLFAP